MYVVDQQPVRIICVPYIPLGLTKCHGISIAIIKLCATPSRNHEMLTAMDTWTTKMPLTACSSKGEYVLRLHSTTKTLTAMDA
jgi:hypothetical protein